MRLEGRRALITGAASGIGRATAQRLRADGARVVLTDVDERGVAEAADAIDAHHRVLDVADPEQFRIVVDETVSRLGGLDILVNSAGIELGGTIVDMSHESFERSLAVNLGGVFNGIKYAAPAMPTGGPAAIVNVASVAALGGGPGIGAYAAAKAGVVQLTRTAALELRAAGVRVNAVLPGFVQTPIAENARPYFEAALGMSLDTFVEARQGRWGRPEDIAATICFLASDDAAFINGSSCVADGGLSVSAL